MLQPADQKAIVKPWAKDQIAANKARDMQQKDVTLPARIAGWDSQDSDLDNL